MEHRFTSLLKFEEMARVLGNKYEAENLAAMETIGLNVDRMKEVAAICDSYNGYSISKNDKDEALADGETVDKKNLTDSYDSAPKSKLHKEPIKDITTANSEYIQPDDPRWQEVSDLNDLILVSIAYITEIQNRKSYNESDLGSKIEHEVREHAEDKEAEDASTKIAIDNLRLSDNSQITGDDIIAYMFLQSLPFVKRQYNRVVRSDIFRGPQGLIDVLGSGSKYSSKPKEEAWGGFVFAMWTLFRYGNKEFKNVYPAFGSYTVKYQTTPIEDAIVKLHTRPSGKTLIDVINTRIHGQITNLFGLDNTIYKTDFNGNEIVDEHGNKIVDGVIGSSRGLGRQIQNAQAGKGYKGDINVRTRQEKIFDDGEGHQTGELDMTAAKSYEDVSSDAIIYDRESYIDYKDTLEKNLNSLFGVIKNSNVLWSNDKFEKINMEENYPDYKMGDDPTGIITRDTMLIDDAPVAKMLYTLLRYPGSEQDDYIIRSCSASMKLAGGRARPRTPVMIRLMDKFANENNNRFLVYNEESDVDEKIDILTFITKYLLSVQDTDEVVAEDTRRKTADFIAKTFEQKFGHPLKIFEGATKKGKLPSAAPKRRDITVNDRGIQMSTAAGKRSQVNGENLRNARELKRQEMENSLNIQNESKENIFKDIFFESI